MQDNTKQKFSTIQVSKARLLTRSTLFWEWLFRQGLSLVFIAHYIIISLIFKFEGKSLYYEDARLWAWVGVIYHFSLEVLQILRLLAQNITIKKE